MLLAYSIINDDNGVFSMRKINTIRRSTLARGRLSCSQCRLVNRKSKNLLLIFFFPLLSVGRTVAYKISLPPEINCTCYKKSAVYVHLNSRFLCNLRVF